MSLSLIDFIFVIIIFFFAVHGAFRGFLDELFSKLAVIVALVCGLFFNSRVVARFPKSTGVPLINSILAFLIIFIVVYICVRLLQKMIGFVFHGDIMRGLDKALGFFLGIGEGILIVWLVLFLLNAQHLINLSDFLSTSFFNSIYTSREIVNPSMLNITGKSNV